MKDWKSSLGGNQSYKYREGVKTWSIDHYPKATVLYQNYLHMSVLFSINYSCVIACLIYAPAVLGNKLGAITSGFLYLSYAVTAFLFSLALVEMFGAKWALFFGGIGSSIYCVAFFFYIYFNEDISSRALIISSIVGGTFSGIFWTAQGQYFAKTSRMYAELMNTEISDSMTLFSNMFSRIYLVAEIVMKLFASLVFYLYLFHHDDSRSAMVVVFFTLSLASISSSLMMVTLHSVNHSYNINPVFVMALVITESYKILTRDLRVVLLLPFQAVFGYASSVVPYYIFGDIIADTPSLGPAAVGVLSGPLNNSTELVLS